MSTTTKNLGLFKYDIVADENVPFSITNALNNNWDILDEAVKGGGGSSRNVGEIIASTIPLTDAGLHLLDGSLIQGDGIYSDFVNYMANVYKTKDRSYNPSAFTITGSPTITNDGIASGFSTNDYISLSSSYTLGTDFELYLPFRLSSTNNQQIYRGQSGTTFVFLLSVESNTVKFNTTDSSSHSLGTPTVIPATDLQINKDYIFVFKIKNQVAEYGYIVDGIYTKTGAKTNYLLDLSNRPLNQVYIGRGADTSMSGSINLKYFKIIKENVEVFNGSTPAKYFTDETNWQASTSQYGVCGKFVYDSVNNTVRLPKITGILEGTTDISALGDLVEAGLPNITGVVGAIGLTDATYSGAFYYYGRGGDLSNSGDPDYNAGFDASRCSAIYGRSTTVQPQTIKAFYYIVIATLTKTDIQIDIDEIATDLNGKVDKSDLQEVQCVVETYQNGASWYRVYSDGWCEQGGFSNTSKTINLLKTYTNTDYTISIATKATGTGSGLPNTVYWTKTTSSFYINLDYVSSNRNAGGEWQACGYIEV